MVQHKGKDEIMRGCSRNTFKQAYSVAKGISDDHYFEYLMSESHASLSPDSGLESWFQHDVHSWCRPSSIVSKYGFRATLYLMFSLFWDLFLLVSLSFSNGRLDQQEMNSWWRSGGFAGVLCILGFLLQGTTDCLTALEFIVIIRFPVPFDQLKFNVDSMDVFFWFGIIFPLVIVGIHYVLVRTEALWCRRKISGAGQLSS
jgi:hypothetical protein